MCDFKLLVRQLKQAAVCSHKHTHILFYPINATVPRLFFSCTLDKCVNSIKIRENWIIIADRTCHPSRLLKFCLACACRLLLFPFLRTIFLKHTIRFSVERFFLIIRCKWDLNIFVFDCDVSKLLSISVCFSFVYYTRNDAVGIWQKSLRFFTNMCVVYWGGHAKWYVFFCKYLLILSHLMN